MFRVSDFLFKGCLQCHKWQPDWVERERRLLKRGTISWRTPFTVAVNPSIKVTRLAWGSLLIWSLASGSKLVVVDGCS
ncbi:unnamed protein product [Brassica oleracea var. botrytis]